MSTFLVMATLSKTRPDDGREPGDADTARRDVDVDASIPRIGAMFVSEGLVTRKQLAAALERQRETGLRLGETLFELGYISSFDLARMLARRRSIEFIDLSDALIDPRAAARLPESVARQCGAVPLSFNKGALRVAMLNPTDVEALDQIRAACDLDVEPLFADPAQLLDTVDALYEHAAVHGLAPAPEPSNRPTRTEASLVAAEIRRMRLADDLLTAPARLVFSTPGAELFLAAKLLAMRNLARFLVDRDLEHGARWFAGTWPPAGDNRKSELKRIAKGLAWLERRVAGPATDDHDLDPVDDAAVDELYADIEDVLDDFLAAMPSGRREWFV